VVAAEPAQPADTAETAQPANPVRRTPLARLKMVAPARALEFVAAAVAIVGGVIVLLTHPVMVDLEIPLRAAERWVHGGEPYLASSFSASEGYGLPFLYPPPVLPLLAPLLALPRGVVVAAWLAATVGAAIFLARRLGVPWRTVPIALCWLPFAEGLVGGNAQVLLVAAFVAVFFDPPAGPWRPTPRDPRNGGRPAAVDGILAAVTPALKLTQPHAWAALLRRRPSAALLGLIVAAAVALATLPLVGVGTWQAWIAQLGRAADPAWEVRGSSLVQLLPGLLSPAATGLTVVLVMLVPTRRLGAAAGLLLVLGAPSLRSYGVLFLLPAILAVRRDVALVAVILIGTGVMPGVWAGILLVTLAFAAGDRLDAFFAGIAARWSRRAPAR
jgi:Glycosyltransferase family 87